MAEKKEFLEGKKTVTFVDLFAGAGGISEGFMQAYTDHNYYDFVLASDINENCELTHRVRYNEQLGLDTKFITEDIMSPTFLPDLLMALDGKQVDVVTGGPSCQSFSLSGRRKRFDKRDGLFNHYLKVIRALRPKYFVMENVKGLLTKDNGRFKVEMFVLTDNKLVA
jgi:DNA (cytosine-5)-methyltransferase 1